MNKTKKNETSNSLQLVQSKSYDQVNNSQINHEQISVKEIINRVSIANNAIMFNYKEISKKDDLRTVNNILSKLKIFPSSIKCDRLGESISSEKTIPLRIKFSHREDALKFIKAKDYHPSDTIVMVDKTRKQRQQYNKIRRQMINFNKENTHVKKIIKYDNNDEPFLIEQIVTQAEVHSQPANSTTTRALHSCSNNSLSNCPNNGNIMGQNVKKRKRKRKGSPSNGV